MKAIMILACVVMLAGCSASVGVGEPRTTTRTTYVAPASRTYVATPVAKASVTETTTTY